MKLNNRNKKVSKKHCRHTLILGGSGSGKVTHPWDCLKQCDCGDKPWLMHENNRPYNCGQETGNIFAICLSCGKSTNKSNTDIIKAIDDWNNNILK